MTTFEVDGETYELDDDMRQYFLARLESENTIDAYFEGGELIHKYRRGDGTIERSVIDVIEVFKTYPSRAKEVINKSKGLTYVNPDSLVSLAERR